MLVPYEWYEVSCSKFIGRLFVFHKDKNLLDRIEKPTSGRDALHYIVDNRIMMGIPLFLSCTFPNLTIRKR